jgi:hypothetical protein
MLTKRKLILDTHCEIYSMIKNHADGIFWNLAQHVEKNELVPDAVYVIGREQLRLNSKLVRQLVNNDVIKLIFSNPCEGSSTIKGHLAQYGLLDLVETGKISIITGGDQESHWNYLQYDGFLPKVLDYDENLVAIHEYQDLHKSDRPYKFLFLNGRARPHRKYLLERFRLSGLLNQSIWTNLDPRAGPTLMLQENKTVSLMHHNSDLVQQPLPVHYLDPKYEVEPYSSRVGISEPQGFVKTELFNNTWGDIYLRAEPYVDTYFSLVTETVYMYPYSFRTEKIWKPVAIGHPFIVVANKGYYRDLHNLGFRTFGHVIDESFDQINNDQQRIERTAEIIEDLCQQDLAAFVKECYNICKYNQQHLAEMRIKVQREFPDRFSQFINQKFNE